MFLFIQDLRGSGETNCLLLLLDISVWNFATNDVSLSDTKLRVLRRKHSTFVPWWRISILYTEANNTTDGSQMRLLCIAKQKDLICKGGDIDSSTVKVHEERHWVWGTERWSKKSKGIAKFFPHVCKWPNS